MVPKQAVIRVKKLCEDFSHYLNKFEEANPFTGPCVYFHKRTLTRLRELGLPAVFDDVLFFEYLYATLVSWGLHRTGPKGPKLVDFEVFLSNFRAQKERIIALARQRLTAIPIAEAANIADSLYHIISSIKVSRTTTQLVAGSKALHHLLPSLMPPIDREYTLKFFYGYNPLTYKTERVVLREIFPLFVKIASEKRDVIYKWIGQGFHTSETKVIDNAIIGFVLAELKGKRKTGACKRVYDYEIIDSILEKRGGSMRLADLAKEAEIPYQYVRGYIKRHPEKYIMLKDAEGRTIVMLIAA